MDSKRSKSTKMSTKGYRSATYWKASGSPYSNQGASSRRELEDPARHSRRRAMTPKCYGSIWAHRHTEPRPGTGRGVSHRPQRRRRGRRRIRRAGDPGGTVNADKLRLDRTPDECVEARRAAKPDGVILPRAVDPHRGRCRQGQDAHVVPQHPHGSQQCRRHSRRRGGRGRRKHHLQSVAGRPARVLPGHRRPVRNG